MSETEKIVTTAFPACNKSFISLGKGGRRPVAKAVGPLLSPGGWRICPVFILLEKLATWRAAPVQPECGCLASIPEQQKREEQPSQPRGHCPRRATTPAFAGGSGCQHPPSPLLAAASLTCSFDSRQRTFTFFYLTRIFILDYHLTWTNWCPTQYRDEFSVPQSASGKTSI